MGNSVHPSEYPVDPAPERAATRELPPVWATWVILWANVLVFVAMAIATGAPVNFPVQELVTWGGNFAPSIYEGEGWRIFTAMFLHAGIIHLAMNMYALAGLGPFLERLLGATSFLLLYLFAGLAGNVLGLLWHSHSVGVGASGAIFGLFGGLFGFLLVHRHRIPAEALNPLLQNGLYFVVVNLVLGFSIPGIDVAAHAVGVAAGFLAGIVASYPFPLSPRTSWVLRNTLLAALCVLIVAATPLCIPASVKIHSQYVKALFNWEGKQQDVLQRYDAMNAEILWSREIQGAAFANRLEKEVVEPWSDIVRRFPPLAELPEKLREKPVVPKIYAYLAAMEESFQLLAQANRSGDESLGRRAREKLAEAERIAGEMKNARKE